MPSYELSADSLFIRTIFPLQRDTSLFPVGGTMLYLLIREKMSHLISTPWFPALSRLEPSSSIYRHGGRRWGWIWSRRLSQCRWRPSSHHRTRVLIKLVISRSTAVAAVTVKMEFQPISLFWGRERGGESGVKSRARLLINQFGGKKANLLSYRREERRGALKPSQQHIKY